MTQAPPPYGTPSGYPPGHGPLPPPKKRPSGWWFVLGGALVVAAAAVGVAMFVWVLSSFLETDAKVPADGQPHVVTVETDGDRTLWLQDGTGQSCDVVDTRTGEAVAQDPLIGSYQRSDSDGEWHATGSFDPGSGTLEVTCTGGGTALVAPAPQIGSFAIGILLTILVPLGLGLAGLVVLLVTGILWAVRPARSPGATTPR